MLFIFSILYLNKEDKNNSNLTKVKLAEVTHSVFYAPLYVAIENGYFKEDGIDLELILTSGADKVAAAVLSNDVDIGFCGTEATIYIVASVPQKPMSTSFDNTEDITASAPAVKVISTSNPSCLNL